MNDEGKIPVSVQRPAANKGVISASQEINDEGQVTEPEKVPKLGNQGPLIIDSFDDPVEPNESPPEK